MRTNGEISVFIETMPSNTVNGNGEPIPQEEVWSDPVPCHVRVTSDNMASRYEDGVFRQATYQCLVEPWVLEDIPVRESEVGRVRITLRNRDLGEHTVISCERVETQNRLLILV